LEANQLSETISAAAPRHSIRTTRRIIIIVLGILIVAMWARVGVALITFRQHAIEDASSQGRNLMIAFREQIAFILRGVDAEMSQIVRRMRREGDGFDLYAWGEQNVLVAPGVAQLTIAGPNGKLRQTTIDPHPRPIDLSDRPHFRIQLDGKFHGLYIGPPAVTQLSGQHFFPISRRVEAEDGTFLGVLIALISPSALTTLPKSIDLGPHGVMTLSGLNAIVLARFTADSPDGIKDIGHSVAGAPRPAIIADSGQGEFVRASPLDGISRVFAYGRVGSYPLVVTVGLDLDRELAQWRTYAAMIVAMTLVVTLLLIGLTIYLIRHMDRDARAARAEALKITHMAEHDFLTGLPNRMLLNDRIGQAIAAAQRRKNNVAVLFLDLDGFKKVNDSLGHPIGDKLLQAVANRLVACVRGSDTVCRQGGDEFVVLLAEVQRPEDAGIIAQKMLEAVAEIHSIDEHELRITTSIGVSIYPQDGLDARTLVKNADTALYQAKESGRQCYRFFAPATNVQAPEGQFAKRDLRLAS
jgi:diguanylate cyclase (GGDEF)-like protein